MRRWFSEDVAFIMECKEMGIRTNHIAAEIDSTPQEICRVIRTAKKYGMDAYPSRQITKLLSSI